MCASDCSSSTYQCCLLLGRLSQGRTVGLPAHFMACLLARFQGLLEEQEEYVARRQRAWEAQVRWSPSQPQLAVPMACLPNMGPFGI